MNKNLRWKALAIFAVLALSVWSFYPPQEKVRLGLDLRGGVHLVLRVQTDDALRLQTTETVDRIREELSKRNIPVTNIAVDSPTAFHVEGIPSAQDAEFRRVADDLSSGLYNRQSGAGGTYRFEMRPNLAVTLRDETVTQALQTIERRVNEFGVAEPVVAPTGEQRRPDSGAAARRHRRRPGQGADSLDGAPRAQAGRGRTFADP